MIDVVTEFIEKNFTPITKDNLNRAIAAMQELEVAEFEDDLFQLIARHEMYDPQDFQDLFFSKVFNYIKQVVNMHDIVLVDDANLGDYLDTLETVQAAQDWLDHEGILRIVETDQQNNERFAELAYTTKGVSMENYLTRLESVSDAFMYSLRDIYVNKDPEETTAVEPNEELIKQIRLVYDFVSLPDALGFKMIRLGWRVGAPLSVYTQRLKRHFEHFSDEQISKEIFVLLNIAGDTYKDVFIGLKDLLGAIYDDLSKITRVDTLVRKLVADFISFKLKKEGI